MMPARGSRAVSVGTWLQVRLLVKSLADQARVHSLTRSAGWRLPGVRACTLSCHTGARRLGVARRPDPPLIDGPAIATPAALSHRRSQYRSLLERPSQPALCRRRLLPCRPPPALCRPPLEPSSLCRSLASNSPRLSPRRELLIWCERAKVAVGLQAMVGGAWKGRGEEVAWREVADGSGLDDLKAWAGTAPSLSSGRVFERCLAFKLTWNQQTLHNSERGKRLGPRGLESTRGGELLLRATQLALAPRYPA